MSAPEQGNPINREAWLLDGVRNYRKLGFFKHLANQPEAAVVRRISHTLAQWEHEEYVSGPKRVRMHFDPHDPRAEPTLLCFAIGQGFALSDWEAGALPGNNVYAKTLTDLGRISRGVFQPSEVREKWGKKGLALEIKLNGAVRRLELAAQEDWDRDWIDPALFVQVDRILRAKGYKLVAYDPWGENVQFVLTATEQERILQQRKLRLWELDKASAPDPPKELLEAPEPKAPAWRFF